LLGEDPATVQLCRDALENVSTELVVHGLTTGSPSARPVIAEERAGEHSWVQREQFIEQFGEFTVQPIQSNTVFVGPSGSGRDTTMRGYLHDMRRANTSMQQLFASSHYHPAVHKAVWGAVRQVPQMPLSTIRSGMGEDSYAVLSVGSDGLGLPFHGHAQAWLAQLQGSKLWYFLPSDTVFSSLPTQVYRELFFWPPRRWSPAAKGYFATHPQHAPLRCLARPGDIIAVPACYYHATENFGESVSLGGQMDITVDENFIMAPAEYAQRMPNSTVQLRNTAMLLEATGDLRAALTFAVALLQQHTLELNMAMRTIRWYARLNNVEGALKTLSFYLKMLNQLHKEGHLTQTDHAKYASDFCLEFQENLDAASFAGLAINDPQYGERIEVPLLLERVYAAAVPHHPSGDKGMAVWKQQFGKRTPSMLPMLLGGGMVGLMLWALYWYKGRTPVTIPPSCTNKPKKRKQK